MKKYYTAPEINVVNIPTETPLLAGSEGEITTKPSQSYRTGNNDYIGTGTDNGDFILTDEID